jgi:ornithine cyclodeaminase
VHSQIAGTGFSEVLDLLADPDDPRDPFGMLMRSALARHDLNQRAF